MTEQAIEQRSQEDSVFDALVQAFEVASQENEDDLINFVLGNLNACDAAEAQIKAGTAKMLKQIKAQRKALSYVYGSAFRERVDAALKEQGGKRKSISVQMGDAGYRLGKERLEIVDERKVRQWISDTIDVSKWAMFRTITTTTSILKTPLLKHFQETGELPDGCEYHEAQDNFYPKEVGLCLPKGGEGDE